MKKNTLLCAFALLLTLFACKKENEPSPQQRILGVWKYSSSQRIIGSTVEDVTLDECGLNSTLEFKADGVVVSTIACDDNAVSTFRYAISTDGRVLTFTSEDGSAEDNDIEELSATTLRVSFSFEESEQPGVPARQSFTFTRQ